MADSNTYVLVLWRALKGFYLQNVLQNTVEHCSQPQTYLLISGMQWPIRDVSVSQNLLTDQNSEVLFSSEFCKLVNPLIITN